MPYNNKALALQMFEQGVIAKHINLLSTGNESV